MMEIWKVTPKGRYWGKQKMILKGKLMK